MGAPCLHSAFGPKFTYANLKENTFVADLHLHFVVVLHYLYTSAKHPRPLEYRYCALQPHKAIIHYKNFVNTCGFLEITEQNSQRNAVHSLQ